MLNKYQLFTIHLDLTDDNICRLLHDVMSWDNEHVEVVPAVNTASCRRLYATMLRASI